MRVKYFWNHLWTKETKVQINQDHTKVNKKSFYKGLSPKGLINLLDWIMIRKNHIYSHIQINKEFSKHKRNIKIIIWINKLS